MFIMMIKKQEILKNNTMSTKRKCIRLYVVLSVITLFFIVLAGFISNFTAFSLNPFTGKRLNRQILDESLLLGRSFILNNQKDEGNFNYEYNFIDRKVNNEISEVRQAGALWGLSLIHHDLPSKETENAIIKGLDFFDRNSVSLNKKKIIKYPGKHEGSSGTVALVSLALIEFLQVNEDTTLQSKYNDQLTQYINLLLGLRMKDGLFYEYYNHNNGNGNGSSSPYFDGEILLALTKAAKYCNFSNIKDTILQSSEAMYNKHVTMALKEDYDSKETKGFYQWSSMAFYEIYTAGWGDEYAKRTIDLAYWMIDVHYTLIRKKNTAYAHEGMISAWQLAYLTKNFKAMNKIGKAIDKGLYRLTSWQIGGPVDRNYFLSSNKTDDKVAIGGIMNSCKNPNLRIDVTQHQMHAVILARRFIYWPD